MLITQNQNSTIQNISKEGVLYLVSTPIGNLEDITLRALKTLKNVDYIACEDTRVTQRLLNHFSINSAKLVIYNDHAKDKVRLQILNKINQGCKFALVSDAGTPLISDPGFKLVQYLIQNNIIIEIIPGVSSPIAALTLSGISSNQFLFIGFLSRSDKAKYSEINQVKDLEYTLLFFESARRLVSTLNLLLEILGDRKAAVIREITKMHQEVMRLNLNELVLYYKNNQPKGEIIIVVEGYQKKQLVSEEELEILLRNLMKEGSLKDSVNEIVSTYSIPKKDVYRIALDAKSKILK